MIRRVSATHPEPGVIHEAAELLRAGRLVAFPTETVYGLGAHAMDPAAVARIFEAKGRPAYNPLIVHVAAADDVHRVASEWPAAARDLARAFWPGPLTLVVPKRPEVPDAVTAGLPAVAVRVPSHPVAQALLAAADIPVAAPSANRSTEVSPTRAAHVERSLGDVVSMILDGGATTVGIESTVVDVTGARPLLLRPGGISRTALEAVVGPVLARDASPSGEVPRSSPGLMDRHYAPRARVVLFDGASGPLVADQMAAARRSGGRIGSLTWSGRAAPVAAGSDLHLELPADPAGYARGLYAALHEVDGAGCALVAIEVPPDGDEWEGIRDRLRRASAL